MNNKNYIQKELENLQITIELIRKFLTQAHWNEAELAGTGKFLADMYQGYENILRALLEEKGINLIKGESWHINLLHLSFSNELIPSNLQDTLQGMLAYRHMQVHGYAYILKEKAIRANSSEVVKIHAIFDNHIRKLLENL